MPRILVTNDDGISSPGLLAATEAVAALGEITVVAPSSQQTSAGRSLRGDKDEGFRSIEFTVKGKPVRAYHCECSPARLVLHAFDVLFCAYGTKSPLKRKR